MSEHKKMPLAPKVLLSALAVVLVLVIFSKQSTPQFKCEFYDSSKGVVAKITPLPGYEFPAGDFEVSVSRSGASSPIAFVRNLFEGSTDYGFNKANLVSGSVWFVCPFEKKIKISISGLNSIELYRPSDGECGKRVPEAGS
jgi:hypothetical protein